MKTVFHKLYLTILVPLVLLGVATPLVTLVGASHDTMVLKNARDCAEPIMAVRWTEENLKRQCNVTVHTYQYINTMDVNADDAWFSREIFSKDNPYSNFPLSLLALIPMVLWFGFGRWVRWLARPSAATAAGLLLLFAAGSARADEVDDAMRAAASELTRQCPLWADNVTRTESVTYLNTSFTGRLLTYRQTITVGNAGNAARLKKALADREFRLKRAKQACEVNRIAMSRGVTFRWSMFGQDGTFIGDVDIRASECRAAGVSL
jgi:hypothetical protein